MDGIREYLLSVTAAAVLCSIVASLTGEKNGVVKLIAGLFLTFTVIAPITRLEIREFGSLLDEISLDGSAAAEEGWEYAKAARMQLIKSETEAYILDKAASYSVSLAVEVTVRETEPFVPEAVVIRGPVSPYTRSQLARIIEQDLGIAKENQQWTD